MPKYTINVTYSQTFIFDTADFTDDAFPPGTDLNDPDVIHGYLYDMGPEDLIDISDQPYPDNIDKITVEKKKE